SRLESLDPAAQEPLEGFSPQEIRVSYLTNAFKEGERRYKLLLSDGDRRALMAVIDGVEPASGISSRVLDNAAFFRDKLANPGLDLATVCRGLSKLRVVDVKLHLGVD